MVDPPISYLQPPSNIVNQALDLIGADEDAILGDINDGTRVAETARRHYGQTLRQMLRANHWPFARRMGKLTLLGDATGNSLPPVSTCVEAGWLYAYAWPTDAVQGRWLPFSPSAGGGVVPISGSGIPLTSFGSGSYPLLSPPSSSSASSAIGDFIIGVSPIGGGAGPTPPTPTPNAAGLASWYPLTPARFLVSSSDQYPIVVGSQPWTALPDIQRTEGLGPINRKVILTDCGPCAMFVYTRLVTTIEEWDDGFRNAMVTAMALVLAPVAISDPKMRVAERDRLIPILRNTLAEARAQASNESGMPQNINKEAIYIAERNRGGWPYGGGIGAGPGGIGYNLGGYYGCGWASCSFGGSVF